MVNLTVTKFKTNKKFFVTHRINHLINLKNNYLKIKLFNQN